MNIKEGEKKGREEKDRKKRDHLDTHF